MDIENYVAYLNAVYDRELGNSEIPVTILGFSQGVATATRWVMDNKIKFKRLILWAGILPPDMDFQTGKEILAGKDVLLVYGKQDPFLNDERFAEMKMLSEKLQIEPHVIEFDGGHQLDEQILVGLI